MNSQLPNQTASDSDKPTLYVVVDTEAEFDWSGQFSPSLTSVSAIAGVGRGQEILERYGLRPVYVVDYPVASQPNGYLPLLRILERGACDIGAHLHPWTTPPFEEVFSEWNSYAGNLPLELEERKLQNLVAIITQNFGQAPRYFKAGRYGIGSNTMSLLIKHGINVDFSIMPNTDLRARGGPDFRLYSAQPYLFGKVLSVPMTRAHVGILSKWKILRWMINTSLAQKLKFPAIMSKFGLLNLVTLTPEGVTAREQITLLRQMTSENQKIFVLHYHSPSLMPGHTPYAKTEQDVKVLLNRIDAVCHFFFKNMRGKAGDPALFTQRHLDQNFQSGILDQSGPLYRTPAQYPRSTR